jgi:PhzF family phenazine biosynthesis protein
LSRYSFDWVDAFTDQAFGGNGCAVVYDAAGLDDETCMAVVRETSLVECTFLESSEVADIRVRYFLASREIPFAGHPTVATVASLVDRGVFSEGPLTLETQAGLIPVEARSDAQGKIRVSMTQNAPIFGQVLPEDLVAAVGQLEADDLIAPPQVVSTGLPFVVALVRDHETLKRIRMNPDALAAMRDALSEVDADVMEPFWVAKGGVTERGQTFSRLVLAPPMPPEDAFTGSATGTMACYLWRYGLTDSASFTAEQGHWMGRPGQAGVQVIGAPEAITGVQVSGQAHILMRGILTI